MTIAVLDNSAAIAFLLDDGSLDQKFLGFDFYAPELIDLEFASVTRRLLSRDKLTTEIAAQMIVEWAGNTVIRCSHTRFLPRIWQLRENFTAYDAAYVALAEHLEIPLLTADLRLAKSATHFCEVMTIGLDES